MPRMLKRLFESQLWEGKRKFTIMCVVIAVSVIFRMQNLIDGHDFALIIKDVSIAFMGANLVKHIINTANDYLMLSKARALDHNKTTEQIQ